MSRFDEKNAETAALQRRFNEQQAATNGKSTHSVQSVQCPEWTPFPTDLLPPHLRSFTKAQAAALGCDEAMIGPATLVVCAAAIGNSLRIELKNTWQEPSTLWLAAIASSGMLKSPAISAAISPVSSLEIDCKDEYEGRMYLYEQEMEEYKSKSKKELTEEPVEPTRRRLRVSDTTIESLAVVHAENPRGLLLARDELSGWVGSFDTYKRGGSDMQSWIEMYDGKLLQIDRKTSNPPVLDIRYPAVSVLGTVQPRVYADKLTEAHFVSGFLPRQLLVAPPEQLRRWTEADVSREVKEAYHRQVRSLYEIPFDRKPGRIGMTAEAKSIFVDFVNANGGMIANIQGSVLRSVFSKIEAIAARLALILHVCDNPKESPGDVSGHAMERAVLLAKWFRNESVRIYDLFGFEEQSLSKDERLVRDLPDRFTWKDVADHKGIEKSGAFKTVRALVSNGLVEDDGHGYWKCTGHYGHYGHYEVQG